MLKADTTLSENDIIGLAIRALPNGDRHTGVLFHDGTETRFLHLKGDEKLKADPPKGLYWFPDIGIEDSSVKKSVAIMCAVISDALPTVPCAFDRADMKFDQAGRLVNEQLGKGMTCATFVLAVFDSIGFPLLFEKGWPIETERSDILRILVATWRGERAKSVHAAKAETDGNVRRFWPSQVVGASTDRRFPVSYARAKLAGRKIEKALKDIAAIEVNS